MRNITLALLLLATIQPTMAQRNLSGAPQHSIYTKIYRIDPSEAWSLFSTEMQTADEKFLHTLVDSVLYPLSETPGLASGNYLFVTARGPDLNWELRTIGDLRFTLISNGHELGFTLNKPDGTLIGDAQIRMSGREIPYDPVAKTYHTRQYRAGEGASILWHGTLYFCQVNTRYAGWRGEWGRGKRGRGERGRGMSDWSEHLFQTIKWELRRSRMRLRRLITRRPRAIQSFMVFSKPKYKPGDTVNGKAFIAYSGGRLLDEPVRLVLYNPFLGRDTTLMTLRPYRPGCYSFSFVLNDSLHLKLDADYRVRLMWDEDKRAADGRLRYEDYELQSLRFQARADKSEIAPGDPLSVYFRATDENDLPMPDARVHMTVLSGSKNTFRKPNEFIPDTLWEHRQALDPVGETRIVIPEHIFPAADMDFEIECELLTSNNEFREESISGKWKDDTVRILLTQEHDSVRIDYRVLNKSRRTEAIWIAGNDQDDTIAQERISLPAVLPINPHAETIEVMSLPDSIDATLEVENERKAVQFDSKRSPDSVTIVSINPKHLDFWYTIFAGNRIVARGYTRQLNYRERSVTPKNYFLSVQYFCAGKLSEDTYTLPLREKLLRVQLVEPRVVYPGEETDLAVSVKDIHDRPVAGADVTAYSFTSKFDAYRLPGLPYFGKSYPRRKLIEPLSLAKDVDGRVIRDMPLNWERWSREMRLDSMEYYRFLHPATVYVNTENAADRLTQIAPFVSVRGVLQAIHQVYIDEKPVYFSQSGQLRRYSFLLAPGRHSIRLRTYDRMVSLDSVWAERGKKTFLCVNGDAFPSVRKMPDTLTNYEAGLWNRYMMVVGNNFEGHLASITQGADVAMLNYKNDQTGDILTGPFGPEAATLHVRNAFGQAFEPEGGYRFLITKGLIKEKQTAPLVFSKGLDSMRPEYDFRDLVLTEKEVDSLWQDLVDDRCASVELFRNAHAERKNNGMLEIGIDKKWDAGAPFIKGIFLFRYDEPGFLQAYRGKDRNLGYLWSGQYRMLFLLKGNSYILRDSVLVRPDGLSYYEIDGRGWHAKDSMSLRIAAILEQQVYPNPAPSAGPEKVALSETFNERYLDISRFWNHISGRVTDSRGAGLSGVTVMIRGTRIGTVTDRGGHYTLGIPEKGVLVFSAVGFSTTEKPIRPGNNYDVVMTPMEMNLDEVVVVGYGMQRKRNMTGSVSLRSDEISGMVEGKVAGVQIQDASQVEGSREEANQGEAGKEDAGQETDKAPEGLNTMRRRFRDDAFWQPMLTTDASGMARFHVRFPDDITNWQTYALVVGDKRQTGLAQGAIKSYRVLSANLSSPAFAVTGDSMRIIGKLLNYGAEPVTVRRDFSVDGVAVTSGDLPLSNAHLDSFTLRAGEADSLHMNYTIRKTNGYFDGEERVIPVYPAGVRETSGVFAPLEDDTSFVLSFDKSKGKVTLYAESSVLPVLLDEIEHVQHYQYLCNEQLASKLMTLLQKKLLYHTLGKEFREERNINELISRLNKSKGITGLWGWWNDNDAMLWISRHVIAALLDAERAGYPTQLDKRALTDYILFAFDEFKGTEAMDALRLLQELGAKADYARLIDTVERRFPRRSLYEELVMAGIRQKAGLETRLDTLLPKHRLTAMGNWYWGEECTRFFDNSIGNTLQMYNLLKESGGHFEPVLRKMRNYFLEKRRDGNWRNTYESCLILNTILPDLLRSDPGNHPPTLVVNGGDPVSVFPYHTVLSPGGTAPRDTVRIGKRGAMPVYFTAYQQYWNHAPQLVDGEFAVRSYFEKDGDTVKRLIAGQPVLLRVDVTVKGDADYVMIEVPIPAGCSYRDKEQGYWPNEVHREYFKNKVSIFCRSLRAGQYNFTISLMPRYSGSYHLNPAKAELMYFPVLYGRERMKMVDIQ
ncbi:MAG: carboxypeptidase-like regulatory domain-containing protein [Bacteroidota bacterium]|nr:carboxypeptidase-like regulatory domain-containing protein [Bacteroidota bacterium]